MTTDEFGKITTLRLANIAQPSDEGLNYMNFMNTQQKQQHLLRRSCRHGRTVDE